MKRRLLWSVTAALFVWGGCFGSVQSAHALSLSPSIIELQANPGETKTVTLTLTNDEAEPLQIAASIQKFLPLGTGGQQRFLPPEDVAGIPSWTFVGLADQLLRPGEKRNVPIQIRVPADAPSEGAYEAIFFSGTPLSERVSGNVGLRSRIGALVLLTVGGDTQAEIAISEWSLKSGVKSSSLRGVVQMKAVNKGRAHVVPRGDLVIRSMTGRIVQRLPINASAVRILPGSERLFEIAFGSSDATSPTEAWKQEITSFGVGRYTISIEGVEGLVQQPSALYIDVFPWRLATTIVLLLIMGGITFVFYRRYLIRALSAQKVV